MIVCTLHMGPSALIVLSHNHRRVLSLIVKKKFQNSTNMYVDIEVMEFSDTVMEKSWNFVATILWQPCMSSM